LDLQTLKLFSLASKRSIIHGTCGFVSDAIWIVDGNNKITQIGSLRTKDLALWWNNYINENISSAKDLTDLINQGLIAIKSTEFGNSELGVSLVIARETENDLEVLLIGDCEAIIGREDEIEAVIKVEKNRQITDSLISKMVSTSQAKQCSILKSRPVIEKDLQTKVRGVSEESYSLLRGKDKQITSDNSMYKKFNKRNVTHITLLNGGTRQYYTVFEIGDISEIYQYSKSNNFIELYERVCQAEKEDLDCNTYPRIKPMRSYMLISVGI